VGKQRGTPGGIFYTGSSGIWQTVWLEPVAAAHVDQLEIPPNLTGFTVIPRVSGVTDERVELVVAERGAEVASTTGEAGRALRVRVPAPRLWSPDDPHLYDLTVRLLGAGGRVVDEVPSYAGLRTIGIVKDAHGRPRIALNGEITFLHGPLDQGYWPDGISTAPTDEALPFDLEKTKELGSTSFANRSRSSPHAGTTGRTRWDCWCGRTCHR
jgi:hypothetical protein